MTTQIIQAQTGAVIGRQGQLEAGTLAKLIKTTKKLLGARFNRSPQEIDYNAKAMLQHKAEVNAYLSGVGLV